MFAKSTSDVLASLHSHLRGDGEPTRITLDAASAVLSSVGMDIAPATLRRYAAGDRDPPLVAEKHGKTWLVDPRDVIAWALRYRAAPKIGRRGDGSVRRKAKK